MRENKKGASTSTMFFGLMALVLVVGVFYFGMQLTGEQETTEASIATTTVQTETGVSQVTGLVSCPSDGSTDGQVRYKDGLASTNTYGAPTVYFMPQTSGLKRVTSGALQTDGTYSTAVDLKCTGAGTKWKPVSVAQQNQFHSVDSGQSGVFTAEGTYVQRDLVGKKFSGLQFKVEDKFTGAAKYFNITQGASGTTGPGTYTVFNGTTWVATNTGGETGTSLTLAADGYIDARIYLKTNQTKSQFGEDGLRTWLLVDASPSVWDEPIVARGTDPKFVDQKASLQPDDLRFFGNYEYAYSVGSFGDRESYIDFYQQTASGVNPGASDDITVDICAESRYNSNKKSDAINVGCYDDAATQALVASSNRHTFQFDVS
jgi:hypothetical protein